MATGDTTKDAKAAKADQAKTRDLPEPKDSRELTPDEEKQLVGGVGLSVPTNEGARPRPPAGLFGN